jgi:hypothetical protein
MTIYATAATRRPILYSPGFGAGWSTWADGEVAIIALTYQPIIDALEAGETLSDSHPAVLKLHEDIDAKTGVPNYFYGGGLRDLKVMYVEGDFDVDEYDGSETVIQHGGIERVRV